MFIYFWGRERERERERERTGEGQRERGRHRIRSRLQALRCQHRAWHGAGTHKLRSWPELKLDIWLSHPGAPCLFIFERDRERERESASMSREGEEREGDTESEAGSRLWVVSPEPEESHKPTNSEIMTWAEVRRLTDWATQLPQILLK